FAVSTVSSDKNFLRIGLQNERGPQGRISAECASREMASRSRSEGETLDIGFFTPIEFGNFVTRKSPFLQVSANSQSSDNMGYLIFYTLKSIIIQMIPMVVCDDQNIYFGEVICRIGIG